MILAAILLASLAGAQTTELASVDSSGAQGNADSGYWFWPRISADGRFVAFASDASNLVAGDTNVFMDTFVHDRLSGATERVSVATGGAQGNLLSGIYGVAISADGRFVAFNSHASNLVAGDTNGWMDIFVRDRQSGTTERVSVDSAGAQGTYGSTWPAISADGRFVAFTSGAPLVAGDTNGLLDVFVRDRQSGTTERVSVDSAGIQGDAESAGPSISPDGRFIAFCSWASNLVPGDTNGERDAFIHDRQSGMTELVSVATGGAQGNLESFLPTFSADGRFVAFVSLASNLVAGDTNGCADVFVHDRQSGTTERVSVSTSGAQGSLQSQSSFISADGRFVAFESQAPNLVAGDTNGVGDVFVRDRQSGTTERLSAGPGGVPGNGFSAQPAFSADARLVVFDSGASNLVAGDTNGFADVFVRDRGAQPVALCPGDGSAAACPCMNNGTAGAGCENSASTGGAVLHSSWDSSLSNDTLVLISSGELPHALSIVLQGTAAFTPVHFGDGLRCVSGALRRLYTYNASGGVVMAPEAGDPSISARSAALGDPLSPGTTRYYQIYYRDPVLGFCASPAGDSWNVSSGVAVFWGH